MKKETKEEEISSFIIVNRLSQTTLIISFHLFHFLIYCCQNCSPSPLFYLLLSFGRNHLQAIVGDKTIAFFLMDREMYSGMSCLTDASPTIERGIALHKVFSVTSVQEAI